MYPLSRKKDTLYVWTNATLRSPWSSSKLTSSYHLGNGQTPCANCLDRSEVCIVTPKRTHRLQGTQGTGSSPRHRSSVPSRSSRLHHRQRRESLGIPHMLEIDQPDHLTHAASASPQDVPRRNANISNSGTVVSHQRLANMTATNVLW